MISVSPSGWKSGRRGSRTLTTSRPHSVPHWRGNPYPAAFRSSVDPAGIEPALSARQADVLPLDDEPMDSVAEVGVEPTDTRLSTWPLCLFAYPAMKSQ